MKFFTPQASHDLRQAQGKERWEQAGRDYEAHLNAIRPRLSADWLNLAGRDFHDELIVGVDRSSKREKKIEFTRHELSFQGVTKFWLPDKIVGARWLYQEIHLEEDGTPSLHVLLDTDEIMVASIGVQFTPLVRERRD